MNFKKSAIFITFILCFIHSPKRQEKTLTTVSLYIRFSLYDQKTEVVEQTFENINCHFGLYKESGFLTPFFLEAEIILGTKYNYAFKTYDSTYYSFLSLNVGLTGIFEKRLKT